MRWTFLNSQFIEGPKCQVPLPSGGLSAMAAFLVLNEGHAVPRDRLEDILWGDDRPARARDRINTMLWRLRKLLRSTGQFGQTISNDRDTLTYHSETPVACDVVELGNMAKSVLRDGLETPNAAKSALRCIDVCHTEFLPFAHDHWSIVTRESLRSGHLIILEALIRHMRKAERWARVSELAERMLAIDPTLEAGHRELIDMHEHRRDPAAVQRQYGVMKRIVEDGLDTAPETASALDALKIAKRPVTSDGSKRQAILMRPTIKSVETAIDHIEAAKSVLIGRR